MAEGGEGAGEKSAPSVACGTVESGSCGSPPNPPAPLQSTAKTPSQRLLAKLAAHKTEEASASAPSVAGGTVESASGSSGSSPTAPNPPVPLQSMAKTPSQRLNAKLAAHKTEEAPTKAPPQRLPAKGRVLAADSDSENKSSSGSIVTPADAAASASASAAERQITTGDQRDNGSTPTVAAAHAKTKTIGKNFAEEEKVEVVAVDEPRLEGTYRPIASGAAMASNGILAEKVRWASRRSGGTTAALSNRRPDDKNEGLKVPGIEAPGDAASRENRCGESVNVLDEKREIAARSNKRRGNKNMHENHHNNVESSVTVKFSGTKPEVYDVDEPWRHADHPVEYTENNTIISPSRHESLPIGAVANAEDITDISNSPTSSALGAPGAHAICGPGASSEHSSSHSADDERLRSTDIEVPEAFVVQENSYPLVVGEHILSENATEKGDQDQFVFAECCGFVLHVPRSLRAFACLFPFVLVVLVVAVVLGITVGINPTEEANNGSAAIFGLDPELLPEDNCTWAKLTATGGMAGDIFGDDIAFDGETIISGARGHRNDSGAAFIFIRNGTSCVQQAKLLPNDTKAGMEFGESVAVDGNTAIVGAEFDSQNGARSGSAYVFTRQDGNEWVQEAKLLPNDAAAGELFGTSVAVDGDTAIVGSKQGYNNGTKSGSAFIFFRNDQNGTQRWMQQAKLFANDGAENDSFGESVALESNTAVVAATADDDNGSKSGAVYVFIRSGAQWEQQAKLLPNDGSKNDAFGETVALQGNTIAIGAEGDDDNGSNSGSVYIFTRTGPGAIWSQEAKLVSSDGEAGDRFGQNVGIGEDTLIVGAYGNVDKRSCADEDKCGAAYI